MKLKESIITLEKLTNLFSLFFIGTLSFIVKYFILPSYTFIYINSFSFALFITGVLTYEFVILSLLPHYTARSIDNYNKHKKSYFWGIVIVLIFTFSIADAIKEDSFWVFVRDIALIILTIILAPKIAKKLNGNETTKTNL